MTGVVEIACCPEHGLHGCRSACFECGGPVDQMPMITVAEADERRRRRIPVGLRPKLGDGLPGNTTAPAG
jgi:hypothetical protein